MPRIFPVSPHTPPQKNGFLCEVVLGLAADGHPEEGVEDGVGGVRLVVVVADSPGLGAVGVQQLYRHLPALTELK